MQLYALNFRGEIVLAQKALRGVAYRCAECGCEVRRRGGPWRQDHYYHLESVRPCRQKGKSLEHLMVQRYLLEKLPFGECFLEKKFREIDRIADAAWVTQGIIFEVQCSPISVDELIARNIDYAKCGYRVVWILHDARYNQSKLTAIENFLEGSPHYFSDMGADGEGVIYDQFSLLISGKRLGKLTMLPIDIAKPLRYRKAPKALPLRTAQKRAATSPLYFSGDLICSALEGGVISGSYISKAMALEEKLLPIGNAADKSGRSLLKKLRSALFIKPWRLLFQLLLERACR